MLNAIIGDLLPTNAQFYENHQGDSMDDHLIEALTFHAHQDIPK